MKGIHTHIAKDNPEAAQKFTRGLVNELFKLAELGVTGSPRDWVSPGLRSFPYKERCFYFRIVKEQMIVVRVLHGKQDVDAQGFGQID